MAGKQVCPVICLDSPALFVNWATGRLISIILSNCMCTIVLCPFYCGGYYKLVWAVCVLVGGMSPAKHHCVW